VRRAISAVLLAVVLAASSHVFTVNMATCVGADPCNACKNCRYCKHCAHEGGTCGVCKPQRSSSQRS